MVLKQPGGERADVIPSLGRVLQAFVPPGRDRLDALQRSGDRVTMVHDVRHLQVQRRTCGRANQTQVAVWNELAFLALIVSMSGGAVPLVFQGGIEKYSGAARNHWLLLALRDQTALR